MKRIVLVVTVLIVVVIGVSLHHTDDGCKWTAPLKANYVICKDGTVRER